LKVLFVQNIEGIAGSEKYFWQLLPALKSANVEVEFLCVHKKKFEAVSIEFAQQLKDKNIVVHFIETVSYTSPFLLFKIRSLIKKGKFDLLHSHLIYADFWSAILKSFFRLNITTVTTLHGYQEDIYTKFCLEPKSVPVNRYYKTARFCYKRIDNVYACSEGLKNFFDQINIRTKKPIEVIHHGFDYPELNIKPNETNQFICAIIGRLIPRKGHEFVLKNCKRLVKEIPGFHLMIVGDGPLRESMQEYIRIQKLEDSITFTGEVDDARIFMAQSEIVLVPSFAEGLPLVIFEAMSVSKPVIAFDTIGPSEVVLNNETGYLIEPFNDNLFCDKIILLSKDKDRRIEMGKKAKKTVKEKFSLAKMTAETIRFYQISLK